MAIQLITNKILWPRSGWSIRRITTVVNNKKLIKYFICEFWSFSKVKIFTVVKIKKGFKTSIGWT